MKYALLLDSVVIAVIAARPKDAALGDMEVVEVEDEVSLKVGKVYLGDGEFVDGSYNDFLRERHAQSIRFRRMHSIVSDSVHQLRAPEFS